MLRANSFWLSTMRTRRSIGGRELTRTPSEGVPGSVPLAWTVARQPGSPHPQLGICRVTVSAGVRGTLQETLTGGGGHA